MVIIVKVMVNYEENFDNDDTKNGDEEDNADMRLLILVTLLYKADRLWSNHSRRWRRQKKKIYCAVFVSNGFYTFFQYSNVFTPLFG